LCLSLSPKQLEAKMHFQSMVVGLREEGSGWEESIGDGQQCVGTRQGGEELLTVVVVACGWAWSWVGV
jgi:hypothetical protein